MGDPLRAPRMGAESSRYGRASTSYAPGTPLSKAVGDLAGKLPRAQRGQLTPKQLPFVVRQDPQQHRDARVGPETARQAPQAAGVLLVNPGQDSFQVLRATPTTRSSSRSSRRTQGSSVQLPLPNNEAAPLLSFYVLAQRPYPSGVPRVSPIEAVLRPVSGSKP